jgi:hypothetical protein
MRTGEVGRELVAALVSVPDLHGRRGRRHPTSAMLAQAAGVPELDELAVAAGLRWR